jgi:hypothetical protein
LTNAEHRGDAEQDIAIQFDGRLGAGLADPGLVGGAVGIEQARLVGVG